MAESYNGEHLQMAEDCELRQDKLTKWEAGFIASIGSQLGGGKNLSQKQEGTLTKIWESCTKDG